jgi:L-serine dehydratase
VSAAFIAQAMIGSPLVFENAAKSALEHHLGMTWDPVAAYVQVPGIERCAFGAVKAWIAFVIATNEIAPWNRVDLGTTINTLAENGRDMGAKHKETSEGSLGRETCLLLK